MIPNLQRPVAEERQAPKRPVTLRAAAIALVSVAFLCGITPYNDFTLGSTYIAGNLFPIGALAVMLLLIPGVNVFLRYRRPGAALSPGELLTV